MIESYIAILQKMLYDYERMPDKLIILEAKIIIGEVDYDYHKRK